MYPAPDPLTSLPKPCFVLLQGTSRGIGLEFVRQILPSPRLGRLYATCRHPQHADKLQELQHQYPDKLRILPLDVTHETSIEQAVKTVQQETPHLHFLLNCAGILHHDQGMRPEKQLADIQMEMVLQSFQVNALGPMLVAKHFAPLFRHKARAWFVNLSARIGSIEDNHLGGWYSYRTSKAAQNMFTKTLAIELRRRSPQTICIALHPGTTDTKLSAPFQRNVPPEKLFSTQRCVQQLLQVLAQLTPDNHGQFLAWDGQLIPW